MEKSSLVPFLRKNLDVLFVGLNPATGSSRNRHYFSVNQSFWSQLHEAGLVTRRVNKSNADNTVFGTTSVNLNNWQYGITDLLPFVAESDSTAIKPTEDDCRVLVKTIADIEPRSVVLLHSKVVKNVCKYLGLRPFVTNCGRVGQILEGVESEFFCIAFPHGNTIPSELKVARYAEIRAFLESDKRLDNGYRL